MRPCIRATAFGPPVVPNVMEDPTNFVVGRVARGRCLDRLSSAREPGEVNNSPAIPGTKVEMLLLMTASNLTRNFGWPRTTDSVTMPVRARPSRTIACERLSSIDSATTLPGFSPNDSARGDVVHLLDKLGVADDAAAIGAERGCLRLKPGFE